MSKPSRGTVLVIDDEEDFRDILAYSLIKRGWRVVTAPNGEEGLAALRRDPPSVVLCDYLMPGMNGLTVLEAAKRESPGTRFVIMTGHTAPEVRDRARELGSLGPLFKPFDPPALWALLED